VLGGTDSDRGILIDEGLHADVAAEIGPLIDAVLARVATGQLEESSRVRLGFECATLERVSPTFPCHEVSLARMGDGLVAPGPQKRERRGNNGRLEDEEVVVADELEDVRERATPKALGDARSRARDVAFHIHANPDG
jgi:hypothetical protein